MDPSDSTLEFEDDSLEELLEEELSS